MGLRLGFYYHTPAVKDNDKIFLPGYLGRFLDSLSFYCENLILFLHQPNNNENVHFDYTISSKNIILVSLPPRGSDPYRMFHARRFTKIIKNHLSGLDAIFLRGPSPLVPVIARSTDPLKKIFLIVGDLLAGVDSMPQPFWRKELIRVWTWYNAQKQFQAVRRCLVFVNSRALVTQFNKKVKNLVETRTTTLTTNDFFTRDDTCALRPIHLLYTGRLDPAKGLLDMVEAIVLLVRMGEDIVLDLVGWPEKNSNILSQISALAKKEGIEDRIIYHGYKAVGPELFAYYKAADIYVIASQSSFEGFPRTIWEAMAHCVPVVATRVGSIPDFIEGAAELVEPKNPNSLARGIKRVIDHSELRKKYITRGTFLASQNTLEKRVGEMANEIINWIGIQ